VINQLQPATQQLAESFPKLRVSFAVITEFFNELASNPGPSKGSFLFFLAWDNHDLNSVVSSADAHGPLGRAVTYFNCEVLGVLKGVQEVNPTVNLLVNLLKPPTKAECESEHLTGGGGVGAKVARAHAASAAARGPSAGVFSGLGQRAFAAGAPVVASAGGGR
jgi:hypothetical protein